MEEISRSIQFKTVCFSMLKKKKWLGTGNIKKEEQFLENLVQEILYTKQTEINTPKLFCIKNSIIFPSENEFFRL